MEQAIEIHNLSLTFRGRRVLQDITLSLPEGSFLGLIGPNGAGKTVLLKSIAGLLSPDSGEVLIYGKRPREMRGVVGYVPQFGTFDQSFPITVFEVVMMGRLARRGWFRPFTSADRRAALSALDRVELADCARREVGRLSGGQLQRVLIARALAMEPRILLLDEPTASLDTTVGRTFYDLLQDIAKETTIVLVSHDIGVIAKHVKTIACLNKQLYYHESKEITGEILEQVYGCPVELIAHGHAHRVFPSHEHGEGGED